MLLLFSCSSKQEANCLFYEGQTIEDFDKKIKINKGEDISGSIGYLLADGVYDQKFYELENGKSLWVIYKTKTRKVDSVSITDDPLGTKTETWKNISLKDLNEEIKD